MLFGQGVHPGPGGEVFRALRAAVQHHDQSLQAFVGGGRNVEPVAACARRAGIALIEELGAVGQGQFRHVRRLAKTRQSVQLQSHATRSKGIDDLAQGLPEPIGPGRKKVGSVTGGWQGLRKLDAEVRVGRRADANGTRQTRCRECVLDDGADSCRVARPQ